MIGSNGSAVIGVDPGYASGAAVRWDGGAVDEWVVWWRTKRKGVPMLLVETSLSDDPRRCLPAATGQRVALRSFRCIIPGAELLAVEGLFAVGGRGAASGRELLPLSHSAGVAEGVLAPPGVATARPLARVWRHSQLGLPGGTKAAIAEKVAIERSRLVMRWRFGFPVELPKIPIGALCEAAWIARYGATVHQWEGV